MSRPFISVCVVTYNQRAFIGECLHSILSQVVDADVVVLVGDDASEDGTSEVVATLVAEHPGRIRHFIRKPRMGGFANMRDLISRAEGNFVARVDGDDYWLPGKLQRQLDYLLANPDCAAVYTNAITVRNGNGTGLFNDVGDRRFDLAELLRRGNFLNNSSVLFRHEGRQAWLSVDQPQIDYRVHLWHACHGWIGHIGEPLAAYRVQNQDSMISSMNDRVRELYWEAILSVPRGRVADSVFANAVADFMRRVVFRALATRNWSLAQAWWPRVRSTSPYDPLRTMILVLGSVARIGTKILIGRLRSSSHARHSRVMYRR